MTPLFHNSLHLDLRDIDIENIVLGPGSHHADKVAQADFCYIYL